MPTNPGTANLVAWWSLDETSGNRADSHGSLTLTDVNTVGSATGKQGNAAAFVAANSERLERTDALLGFDDSAPFSWCGWCYLGGDGQAPMGQFRVTAHLRGPLIRSNGTDIIFQWYDSTDTSRFVTGGSFSYNTWAFVAAGYDLASDLMWCSVNGAAKATQSTAAWSFIDGGGPFQIGADGRNGGFVTGRVDEVGIFNDVLTNDEIAWLYNGGAGRTYAELSGGSALPIIMQAHAAAGWR